LLSFSLPWAVLGDSLLAQPLFQNLHLHLRILQRGAGIDLKTNTATAEALAKAVRCVLNQPRYRSSAAQLATEFAKLDARQEVIRIFDELACAVSHIHQE
jgi:hypothetical protein